MSLYTELKQYWTRKKLCVPKEFDDKTKLGWNFYGLKEVGQAHLTFYKVHLYFKYWLIYPIIAIAKRIFKTDLDTPIPNESYNKNLVIFNDAYERTTNDWYNYFFAHRSGYTRDKVRLKAAKEGMNAPQGLMRVIKRLFIKFIINDSAYRPFFDMLMHNIALDMLKYYGGVKNKHLHYNSSDIYDVQYYLMEKVISNGQFNVEDGVTVTFHKAGGTKQ